MLDSFGVRWNVVRNYVLMHFFINALDKLTHAGQGLRYVGCYTQKIVGCYATLSMYFVKHLFQSNISRCGVLKESLVF